MKNEHNLECISNNTFFNDGSRASKYQCQCGFDYTFKHPLNESKINDTLKKAINKHNQYIVDNVDIKYYLCEKCNVIHYKQRKKDNKPIKIFIQHAEYIIEILQSDIWKYKFKQSAKRYNIEKHKKSIGSNKQ